MFRGFRGVDIILSRVSIPYVLNDEDMTKTSQKKGVS